jgi:hypothetical protein
MVEPRRADPADAETVPRDQRSDEQPAIVHVSIRTGPMLSVDDPELVDW